MKQFDRALLLITGLLAAYQIVVGVKGADALAGLGYLTAFGVLLVAGLLLIIFGFEILASPIVVVVAALIPLGLAFGLVAHYFAAFEMIALGAAIIGLLAIAVTRFGARGALATMALAVVHGVAGILIFGLPIVLWLRGSAPPGFALVGGGGALIGLGGLLLSFLKVGKPILAQETILRVLPGLLLLMTASFVAGFAAL